MANKIDTELLAMFKDEELEILINSFNFDVMAQPFKMKSKKFAKYMPRLGNLSKKSQLASKNLPIVIMELHKRKDYDIDTMISINAKRTKEMFVDALAEKDISIDKFSNMSAEEIVDFLIEYDAYKASRGEMPLFLVQLKMCGISFDEGKIREIKELWKVHREVKEKEREQQQIIDDAFKEKDNQYKLQLKNLKKEYDARLAKLENSKKDVDKELKSKKKEIDQLSNEKIELYTKIAEANKLVDSQNDELSKKKVKIAELENNLKELKGKIANDKKVFKEEWVVEVEEEHSDLLDKIAILKIEVQDKNNKIELLDSEYEEKIESVQKLDENIYACNAELADLHTEIDRKRRECVEVEDSDRNISDSMTAPSISNIGVAVGSSLYIEQGMPQLSTKTADSIQNYYNNASTNLEQIDCGMDDGFLEDFCNSAIYNGLVPVFCGYGARKVAMALVAARYGEIPTIISVPGGYSNVGRLNYEIDRADTNVVVVEDLFGKMNEDVILPVLRRDIERQLIFCCEDTECMKYVPQYFYNYIQLIKIDKIKHRRMGKLEYLYANNVFYDNSISDRSEYRKLVKRIFKDVNINGTYLTTRSDVLAYISDILGRGKNEMLEFWFNRELKYILTDVQRIKVIENCKSSSLDISEELIGIIEND